MLPRPPVLDFSLSKGLYLVDLRAFPSSAAWVKAELTVGDGQPAAVHMAGRAEGRGSEGPEGSPVADGMGIKCTPNVAIIWWPGLNARLGRVPLNPGFAACAVAHGCAG